jgi:hypothetical protein
VRQRELRMPAKNAVEREKAEDEQPDQTRPETERYLLQIDRQSKRSFKTPEAARMAALEIKSRFPLCRSLFTTPCVGRVPWWSYLLPRLRLRPAFQGKFEIGFSIAGQRLPLRRRQLAVRAVADEFGGGGGVFAVRWRHV